MKTKIYVCPTCKEWRWLEVYPVAKTELLETVVYCRKCEEGCVKPLIVDDPNTNGVTNIET